MPHAGEEAEQHQPATATTQQGSHQRTLHERPRRQVFCLDAQRRALDVAPRHEGRGLNPRVKAGLQGGQAAGQLVIPTSECQKQSAYPRVHPNMRLLCWHHAIAFTAAATTTTTRLPPLLGCRNRGCRPLPPPTPPRPAPLALPRLLPHPLLPCRRLP